MFPITYFAANGADWVEQGSERPRYFDIGERDYRGNVDDRTLSLIADHPPAGAPVGSHRCSTWPSSFAARMPASTV